MSGYYLQLAWQNIRRSPWLSALIVLTIGVGVGFSMAMFSLLAAMSRDPFPLQSGHLYIARLDNLGLEMRQARHGPGDPPDGVTADMPVSLAYRDAIALRDARLARRQALVSDIELAIADEAERNPQSPVPGLATEADFFDMFGASGYFVEGEPWSRQDDTNQRAVAVLDLEMARKVFPNETRFTGRYIRIGKVSFEIVGVLDRWNPRPAAYSTLVHNWYFRGNATRNLRNSFPMEPRRVFIPFDTYVAHYRSGAVVPQDTMPGPGLPDCPLSMWLADDFDGECAWVRLWTELHAPGEVQRYRQFLQEYANGQQREGRFSWQPETRLESLRDWIKQRRFVPPEYRSTAPFGLCLLLACLISAASLMLARFHDRVPELGIRRALGASRSSVLAQCLCEAALLGVAGAVLGLGLLYLGAWLNGAMSSHMQHLAQVEAGMVFQALLLAIAGAICAGLYPAWRFSRERGASAPPGQFGAALTAVQLALTLAIVANALFIAWQKIDDLRQPTGVDGDGIFHLEVSWHSRPADVYSRVERDLEALRNMPGIVDASQSFGAPGLWSSGTDSMVLYLEPPGLPRPPVAAVASEYFADDHTIDTFGLELIEGRPFRPDEMRLPDLHPSSPVIVSRALAHALFPAHALDYVLGKKFYVFMVGRPVEFTIVGIVERMQGSPGQSGDNAFLVPYSYVAGNGVVGYAVRTRPDRLRATMREAEELLGGLDEERAINPVTYEDYRRRASLSHVSVVAMLAGLTSLLLLTMALGIVGLTWCRVVQRRRQIGIRRALGAQRGAIVLRFQLENLAIVLAGVAAGSVLAIAGNRLLMQYYEIQRIPASFVLAGSVFIVLVSQLAALWPALRAAHTPPAIVTRTI